MYKILHHDVNGLDHLVVRRTDGVTRGHDWKLLHLPFRKNARKNLISVRVSQLWKSLPNDVGNASSQDAFKTKLKRVDFSNLDYEFFD